VLLVDAFIELGVRRVRLTGGEPLVRRDLTALIALLAERKQLEDIALTTNGILLAEQAALLARAGLQRVTVSLDTLDPARFRALTRRDGHEQVLAGIAAASEAGFAKLKLDSVILRGTNEDELVALVEFAKRHDAEVRFIEYMDVGGATQWTMERVFTRAEMLGELERAYGPIRPLVEHSSAPAERFMLSDGTVFGIIASTTAPFCSSCDRSRLTADGMWFTCLYAKQGLNLRELLRSGATTSAIAAALKKRWTGRSDRGAEERLAAAERAPLANPGEWRTNLHLEMHTRGG
jgi:cyclic pyranopterin phosphate synthase